jgi:hypothetical protein
MLGVQAQRLHDLAIKTMDCNTPAAIAEVAENRRLKVSPDVTPRHPSIRRNASI